MVDEVVTSHPSRSGFSPLAATTSLFCDGRVIDVRVQRGTEDETGVYIYIYPAMESGSARQPMNARPLARLIRCCSVCRRGYWSVLLSVRFWGVPRGKNSYSSGSVYFCWLDIVIGRQGFRLSSLAPPADLVDSCRVQAFGYGRSSFVPIVGRVAGGDAIVYLVTAAAAATAAVVTKHDVVTSSSARVPGVNLIALSAPGLRSRVLLTISPMAATIIRVYLSQEGGQGRG